MILIVTSDWSFRVTAAQIGRWWGRCRRWAVQLGLLWWCCWWL